MFLFLIGEDIGCLAMLVCVLVFCMKLNYGEGLKYVVFLNLVWM